MTRFAMFSTRGSSIAAMAAVVAVACAGTGTAVAAQSTGTLEPEYGTVSGQKYSHEQSGGALSDQLRGTVRSDRLRGAGGDDVISGGSGRDRLIGGIGDDAVAGGAGNDDLFGGVGIDSLIGAMGNDRIQGDTGDDRVRAGAGADRVNGGPGADDLRGGLGNDIIFGGSGADTIDGGDGDDIIMAADDNMDVVACGAGHDYAYVDAFDLVDESCEGDPYPLLQSWCMQARAHDKAGEGGASDSCTRSDFAAHYYDGSYSDCGSDFSIMSEYINIGVLEDFWVRRIGSLCRDISSRSDVAEWGACPGPRGSVADAQWAYGTGYISWLCDGAAHQITFGIGEYDLHDDWMYFGFSELGGVVERLEPTAGVACEYYNALEGGASTHYRSRVFGYAYDAQWRLIAVVNHASPAFSCLDSSLT